MTSDPDKPAVCGSGCPCAVGNEFGDRTARHDLDRYRRKGADDTTRWLIDGLRGGSDGDVTGLTVLDVGAGIGAVHLALLEAGASAATDVDGSPAYIAVARDEARRAGLADRVRYETGDFVERSRDVEPADLVALDRVVCCYPDFRALVGLSAAHATRRYGLVYPRDSWWIRAGSSTLNTVLRLFRQRLRFYIHRTADIEAILAAAGFVRSFQRRTLFWQVAIFERA